MAASGLRAATTAAPAMCVPLRTVRQGKADHLVHEEPRTSDPREVLRKHALAVGEMEQLFQTAEAIRAERLAPKHWHWAGRWPGAAHLRDGELDQREVAARTINLVRAQKITEANGDPAAVSGIIEMPLPTPGT